MSRPSTREGKSPTKKDKITPLEEIDQELKKLKFEYDKATATIDDQNKLIQYLRDALAKKDDFIAHLESELQKQGQLHQQELEVTRAEKKTDRLDSEHRVRCLELDLHRVSDQLKVYRTLEPENVDLKEQIQSLQRQLEFVRREYEGEAQLKREEMANHRAQLEEEFRRRLKESEERFREEAFASLSTAARDALSGNTQLHGMLTRQNDSIEAVLAKYKAMESAHSKMKLERDLSQEHTDLQSKELARIRRALGDANARVAEMEEQLKARKVERASLELLYSELEETTAELNALRMSYDESQREVERLRLQVMKHAKANPEKVLKMIKERESAFRALQASMNLTAQQDGSDSELPEDAYAQQQQQLSSPAHDDPLSTLSMWNRNFANYQPASSPTVAIKKLVTREELSDQSDREEDSSRRGSRSKKSKGAKKSALPLIDDGDMVMAKSQKQRAVSGGLERGTSERQREEHDLAMSVLNRKPTVPKDAAGLSFNAALKLATLSSDPVLPKAAGSTMKPQGLDSTSLVGKKVGPTSIPRFIVP